MGDYDKLAAGVVRVVRRLGRTVTIKLETDGTPPDADKPWEPGAPSFVSHVTLGVVTPVEESYVDGVVMATDEQVLVAAQGMPAEPNAKAVVLDGSTQYRTIKVEKIAPGVLPVAYVFIVRR